MTNRTVVFCYRKIIDIHSVLTWEKMIFEDSYLEFKMQFQYFNADRLYYTFADLHHHVPAADRLHFLISPSIAGYMQQFNELIPDVLNTLGKHFMSFKNFKFELINSDIRSIEKHQVAVNFYSEPMAWLDSIGNYLLLSDPLGVEEPRLTNLYQLQPFVNIHSLRSE
ncbi:hypothetical protein [Pedobacter metabolipauper]|uniref:Uncharacterized protein n=1 Tax=Pedobacter metabolipauper TaxID=425513 RepID=A0A4R6STM3_9SPHI|nr:hypothetical protein [Pedobacter metabolipauper]TDQ06976.1 hypothetical protein ATK78_3992 [Pedobacter metabolipauper]